MRQMTAKEQGRLLDGIDGRRAILENAVSSVAERFTSSLFVWGPPGLGKSHLLTIMLDGIVGKGWRHHTAHSTPKALMMSMIEEPDAIHLFEDCETLLKTDLSASLLRAACGAPNERQRIVTYETANQRHRIEFTGGIIIATNENLSRVKGPLQGVASRFRPIKWDMSLKERIASILKIADTPCVRGGVPLTAKECRKVALRLVDMCQDSRSNVDLDLRLFTEHALPAYAQSIENPSMKWEDLLLAKLHGIASTVEQTQDERTRHLEQLAHKIDNEQGTGKDKVAKWKQMTDLGQAIYYRHLRNGKAKIGKK
jgi:hypothetical protein